MCHQRQRTDLRRLESHWDSNCSACTCTCKCFILHVTTGLIHLVVRLLSSDPVEEESGDFRGKDDQEHRQISERDKLRVMWNMERRCYFDSSGEKRSEFESRCDPFSTALKTELIQRLA